MPKMDQERSAVANVLRRYIPPNMVALIAERMDRSVRTVHAWRTGDCVPQLHEFIRLMPILGPAFVNDLLSHVGMGGASWLRPDQCLSALHATVSRLDSALAEARADDVIDHQEEAALRPLINDVVVQGAAAMRKRA